MMYFTDNPVADFERYSAEQEEELENLPICSECGEPIQDEYCFEVNNEYICERCMKNNYRKAVEDIVC